MRCPHGAACIHCRQERLESLLRDAVSNTNAAAGGLLSFQKAAERLDVSWDTVDELARSGQLDVVRGLGKGRKVTEASVNAVIGRLVEEERAPRRRTA